MEKELKKIQIRQDRNFFTLVLIFGALLNIFVISLNGGMMPVKASIEHSSALHFTYQDVEDIKLWPLSDWLGIEGRNYFVKFSIGDILIVLGIGGYCFVVWRLYKLTKL